MNYADVPQQQYIHEHTYPTYLARQQTAEMLTEPLDGQIATPFDDESVDDDTTRYAQLDEQFDFASVVFWYRNVVQSVRKYL